MRILYIYIYINIYVGRGVFNLAPASSPLSLGPIQGLGAGDAGGAFAPPLIPLLLLLTAPAVLFCYCVYPLLCCCPATATRRASGGTE